VTKLDLLRFPLIKTLLRSRWPQFLVRLLALAGFVLAVLAGLLGTPVGSRSFAIVFVWILWWALLMLAAVPLFGRGWCSVCPIPMPGEWAQRGALLGPLQALTARWSLGRPWPRRLRGIWLQNAAFVLVALFSARVLTTPLVSALVLGAFLLVALVTSLIFERRAFCRYLCPVGGFIGLYSQLAPLELRVRNTAVCASHREKTCYNGSLEGPYAGYGCPWGAFPGGLVRNTSCGLCMECLRTCPHDNIALNLRLPGADLEQRRGRGLDEAYKGLIMLGSALAYSAVMLGPWGALKAAAFAVGSLPWLGYALGFLTLVLGVLPGLFLLAAAAGQRLAGRPMDRRSLKQAFAQNAVALVPLGLAAWAAFSLAFAASSLTYIPVALSDPFGWGWDLFGGAGVGWTPLMSGAVPPLQVIVLAGGILWAARSAVDVQGGRAALPVIGFCLLAGAGLLWLLVG
jgi:polyferredoxin